MVTELWATMNTMRMPWLLSIPILKNGSSVIEQWTFNERKSMLSAWTEPFY